MRSKQLMASSAAAVAMAAMVMAACSTTDEARILSPSGPNAVFVGTTGDRAVEGERLEVCKETNGSSVGASFTVSGTENGVPITPVNFNVADGACLEVWVTAINVDANLTVTETAPSGAGWSTSISGIQRTNGVNTPFGPINATSRTAQLGSATGAIITFTNTFTPPPPPPPVCTHTKGWYRNHGENTIVLTIDGRTPNQQRTIFDAKPGQPNGVSWGSDNLLLNLYQQLLAAINNLGGNLTAGPAAVDVAIAAALAGTGGTGLTITTTLTHDQMSDLVDVLSAFNEGQFAGFPHCDDDED